MKIAILGSGGREHALAFSISNSKQTKEIYNTTLDILNKSKEEGITSYSAALKIAKNRIKAKKL